MRSSCVDALRTKNGYWYIVVSPSSTNSTYIITVDCTTGNPLYTGVPFLDIFPDHESAIEALTEIGATKVIHGEGFLGLVANETTATFAIIDKTQISAKLPPNHIVKTVKHTAFINIPILPNSPKNSIYEDFQINFNHFFCDTYDLTRLFPTQDVNHPDYGFVWNNGWRKPFEILGIPQVCTNLIQGVCVSKEFVNFKFSLAYICRRSVLNPGTRYAARGLNDLNSPGNEVECELIFFKDDEFWSERWRRGSIPIRWKTVLSSKLSSPKHKVDKDYFKGTLEYFKGLTERFGEETIIRCVSLLQTNSDHSESQIKEFFKKAMNRLYENGIENVFLTPFDLNRHLHEDGSGEAMMDFLSFIGPLSDRDGFTHGCLPGDVKEMQKGLMRFNCADSLDRTNLATFYYAMKMTADWCKQNSTGLSSTPNASQFQPNLIIHQSIIDFIARAFVESGNVVSQLYTNTQAIKTNAIKKFSPSIVVTANDTNITVQRRLQNVMNDPVRQKVIEMWTQPMPLSWYHRIDARHIFLVPCEDGTGNLCSNQFPRTVFSPLFNQVDVRQKELLLCLPTPMILFSFMILLYPANQRLNGLSVKGGMTTTKMEKIMNTFLPAVEGPIWLRFRPNNAVRWGFEKSPKRYIRFLSFNFQSPDDVFSIGNIRIEARSVFCGEAANSTDAQIFKNQPSLKQMSPSRSSPNLKQQQQQQKQVENSLLLSQADQSSGIIKSISMQPSVPKSATIDGLNNELASQSDNISAYVSDNIDDNNNSNEIAPMEQPIKNQVERFTQSFDKFVRSPQNFANVLELEKTRVGLGLDEETRVQIALSKGVSPWVADARARLATINIKECPFCRFSHTEGVKYFCPSPIFPGLIKSSKFHEKGGFPVCKACNDIAESFSNITLSYELQYSLVHHTEVNQVVEETNEAETKPKETEENENEKDNENENDEDEVNVTNEQSKRQHQIDEVEARRRHDKSIIPHFETCDINRELCKGLQASTHEANAAFLNEESSLLWLRGGSEVLAKDEERKYDLFIVQMAVVLKLVITAKLPKEIEKPTFEVLDFHGHNLSFKKLSSNISKDDSDELTSFEFSFDEQPITQRLKFTIKAIDNVELTNLQAFYIITKLPPEEVVVNKGEKYKAVPLSGSYPTFNMSNRTDSIKLQKVVKVIKMMIEFVIEKSSTTPYSFYLSFYQSGKLVEDRHFVLPEVSNGTKLWYNISEDGISADTIKVFYVDRIASIKPHVIRFVLK